MDANLLQWPAMVVTLVASWFVGSTVKRRRWVGFWLFVASNVAWIAWGVHVDAWGLVTLQLGLAVLNARGILKAEGTTAGRSSA